MADQGGGVVPSRGIGVEHEGRGFGVKGGWGLWGKIPGESACPRQGQMTAMVRANPMVTGLWTWPQQIRITCLCRRIRSWKRSRFLKGLRIHVREWPHKKGGMMHEKAGWGIGDGLTVPLPASPVSPCQCRRRALPASTVSKPMSSRGSVGNDLAEMGPGCRPRNRVPGLEISGPWSAGDRGSPAGGHRAGRFGPAGTLQRW